MKKIEDIKEFEDIDTYYEISNIVAEVFQDRVEAHKHLVTANKEIERLNDALKEYDRGTYCKLINENRKLNNIINELKKYIEDTKQDGYKLVWINEYKNYFEAGIEEILGVDKE